MIVYLIGRSPFLSIPPIDPLIRHTAAIAAGPSQGSITALANSYISWNELSGISLLLLDHASGMVNNVFVKGADLPARTNNSKAASKQLKSQNFHESIIGFNLITIFSK